MEWENIILTAACFAAIAAVAYYFWKKSKSQTQQIEELNKRIEAIELTFAPQPSQATLDKFFPVYSQSHIPQTHYTYTHKHAENTNSEKIIDLTDFETKSTNSKSSQVNAFGAEENELSPLVIKSNRSVDLDAITDNLLPMISSK